MWDIFPMFLFSNSFCTYTRTVRLFEPNLPEFFQYICHTVQFERTVDMIELSLKPHPKNLDEFTSHNLYPFIITFIRLHFWQFIDNDRGSSGIVPFGWLMTKWNRNFMIGQKGLSILGISIEESMCGKET